MELKLFVFIVLSVYIPSLYFPENTGSVVARNLVLGYKIEMKLKRNSLQQC